VGRLSVKRALQVLSTVLAVVAGALVLFLPSYTVVRSDSAGNESTSTLSIWQYNGPIMLLVVAVPVVIALVPALVRGRWWPVVSLVSAGLLLGVAFLGAPTVGFAFLPAVVAAVVAAMMRPRVGASRE
jgi:heme/copper-type cytochrome/quinol oxidase subunit 2